MHLFNLTFGTRVGFVKIKADCTLIDGVTKHENRLPGICFLRGGSVAILVALVCEDEGNKVYSLLVEQPRYEKKKEKKKRRSKRLFFVKFQNINFCFSCCCSCYFINFLDHFCFKKKSLF